MQNTDRASCNTVITDSTTVSELYRQLAEKDEIIRELQLQAQLTADLNLIAPYVTRYYVEIYRSVKREFKNNGVYIEHSSWVDLFSAASAELVRFNEFDTDIKPITNGIALAMRRLGNLNEHDWALLQSVRQARNSHGHPRLSDDIVIQTVHERWNDHDAYGALSKMLRYITGPGRRNSQKRMDKKNLRNK